MGKSRVVVVLIIVVIVATALLGNFLFTDQSSDEALTQLAVINKTSAGLGITYLIVTPGLSKHYGLGVDSGALVTEVATDSPAAQAGIQVGDVILSFNGIMPDTQAPLLNMMMACPAGSNVTLQVWREKGIKLIELFHAQ